MLLYAILKGIHSHTIAGSYNYVHDLVCTIHNAIIIAHVRALTEGKASVGNCGRWMADTSDAETAALVTIGITHDP